MSEPLDVDVPPLADLHAEQCVLGGMMLSTDAIAAVLVTLKAADFFRPAHQLIFDAIVALYEASEPVDPVTVKAELERRGEDSRTGGAPYLLNLIRLVPVAANAGHYAQIVRERSEQRDLEAAGMRLIQLARDPEVDPASRLDAAWKALEGASGGTDAGGGSESFADLIPGYLDRLDRADTDFLPTGWIDLDAMLAGGLRPGQLVIVGARPAVGKSLFLLNIAAHVAFSLRETTLVSSLEMPKDELVARLIARSGKVTFQSLRTKALTADDWAAIGRVVDGIGESQHLKLNDHSGATVAYLRGELRALVRAGNPAKILLVDYLQLMTSGGRAENRQLEVSEISRSLKLLAQEFKIPVVVACQLNRGPEQRADKRPVAADLRESGSLEQDADLVIMLHREDAYDKESPRAGEMDFIVVKHRNGPTGTVTTAFQGHYARIVDMAAEPWSPTKGLR